MNSVDDGLHGLEAAMRSSLFGMGDVKGKSFSAKTKRGPHEYRRDGDVPVEHRRGLRGRNNENLLAVPLEETKASLAAERAMRLHAQRNLSAVEKKLVEQVQKSVDFASMRAEHTARCVQAISAIAASRKQIAEGKK